MKKTIFLLLMFTVLVLGYGYEGPKRFQIYGINTDASLEVEFNDGVVYAWYGNRGQANDEKIWVAAGSYTEFGCSVRFNIDDNRFVGTLNDFGDIIGDIYKDNEPVKRFVAIRKIER